MNKYRQLKHLKKFSQVNLICHCDPDADALSSMVVFKDFLTNKFKIKSVSLFASCQKIPSQCAPILKDEKIFTSLEQISNENLTLYDFVNDTSATVLMDCANKDRIGDLKEIFTKSIYTISIDHHATNNIKANQNYLENISSTSEIIYNICRSFKYKLNEKNLGKLYAGIITDTNNFSVGNFNGNTLKIAGNCLTKKQYLIHQNFFSNIYLINMQILSKAINNIELVCGGKGIISAIAIKDSKELNTNNENYIGIIDRLAAIAGCKMCCFIYPKGDTFYIALRAKKGFDVATIAKKYNGGGHVGASGFLMSGDIEKIKSIIRNEFSKQLKDVKETEEVIF